MEDPTIVESTSTATPAGAPAYSYDDLFPALPESATPKFTAPTNNKMRIGSSVITQVFYVPSTERKFENDKFGEGESLRSCQTIMKETGAHIEITSGKDQSLTFLITGKASEVVEARRKILIHFQTQASKQISIPRDHHRWILGKKGEKLRELEKMTGTKISVPSISEEKDVITIQGTKEGIEKAEHEIRTTSDEQSRKAFERITIPKIYHPFINGPNNEYAQKLADETSCRINIPPQSVMKDEIIITGETEGVQVAKTRILAIFKDMEKKCTSVGVEVPRAQHKYVIGPRGSTIQEILRITGVSVEMPASDAATDTIILRGPHDKLGNALATVYEKANSVQSRTLEAPAWIHKYIIGRKGASIKELTSSFPNVHVEFNEEKIKIEGPPDQVTDAVEQLEKTVKNYIERLTFVEMEVNPNHYKHIIGKAGVNINRIKDEMDVVINIEEKDGTNTIRIEGSPEGVQKAQIELQDMIQKLENEREKDAIIDHRLFRSIIGSKGARIREIREKFNQVVITFPNLSEKSDIVKIRGPKNDVEMCHKHLMKMVKELQESSFMLEVPIFKQFHKFIIGKGGANIKKIRDETQTEIDLPAEGDKNEVIVITGKKENVMEARDRIQKIQNELANIVTEEIQIPPKYYNSLIGVGGKLISSIMEECGGVSIKFPTAESKSDKVTIRGPKDDVERAKQQLLELSNEKQLSSFTAEVRANPKHHRFLIGKKGVSIKKIRDSTGARIIFPTSEDKDKEVITIIGKKEIVETAKAQLEAIIREVNNNTESEMNVDPKHHKHFVAKRGEVINRISEECGGVTISFPRSTEIDSTRVTLKGPKEGIEAAKQRIIEIVGDLESMVTIECVIPQRHHRSVMGKRGAKVQGITQEFDVQVKFPERKNPAETNGGDLINGGDTSGDIIKIYGKLENCEKAKQALIDLVPITEEIEVPFDLHRSIIGKRGDDVRELMNRYDVHIELSPQDQKLDVIKVSGAAQNVRDAKTAIAERVKALEKDREDRELRSFELKIQVEPDLHPKIIGRRGAVINKIRTSHGVQISFPRKEDAGDEQSTIRIQGYEEAAKAARDEILKIVGDYNEMVKEVVSLDARIHSRVIGQRGRHVRQIMEDYRVDIKFPREGDADMNQVTVMGKEEDVEACKDHLLNLEEEYMQDVSEAPKQSSNVTYVNLFENAMKNSQGGGSGSNKSGFVVQGAPWEKAPNKDSQIDFPDFGLSGASSNVQDTTPSLASAWNPNR
ncbi:CLUMA_CG006242, isoform A [Clunio marinus]|uniref:CLUMA_CG006242, isoform A n=1 Tax=Clunio marinus TaxID=568069 RepID=A0A1J1HXG3_9DIPT|nr:CLUMA_CG006242, isoform A [Clunio marinus]